MVGRYVIYYPVKNAKDKHNKKDNIHVYQEEVVIIGADISYIINEKNSQYGPVWIVFLLYLYKKSPSLMVMLECKLLRCKENPVTFPQVSVQAPNFKQPWLDSIWKFEANALPINYGFPFRNEQPLQGETFILINPFYKSL